MNQPCSTDNLTFAEAMALDPSEVEMRWSSTTPWGALDGDTTGSVSDFRHAQFRRARTRKSRAQEMASTAEYEFATGDRHRADYTLDVLTKCIRAVCEYLPEALAESRKQSCELTQAGVVKRHFLEPR